MRSATSSGCSTSMLDCVMTPGIRDCCSGSFAFFHTRMVLVARIAASKE